VITLPLTADPCRTFVQTLGDLRARLTTRWNERAAVWLLDVADEDTDTALATGIPIVLGADLLLAACPRLGTMVAIDTAAEPGVGTDAGPDDLGARVQVVWVARGETL